MFYLRLCFNDGSFITCFPVPSLTEGFKLMEKFQSNPNNTKYLMTIQNFSDGRTITIQVLPKGRKDSYDYCRQHQDGNGKQVARL